ncbi:MAG: hypothetical protein ACTSRH_04240 [Promethearchaeota archaeon]
MSMDQESRFCPYCGEALKKPYWQHVQKEHPDKYKQKETWIKLFKDYRAAGMDVDISIQVISELFNAIPEEVRSFLKNSKAL